MTTNTYNYESDEGSSSSSSSGGPRLTIGEGLSKEALAALAEYQQFGFFSGDDNGGDDKGGDASAASNHVIQKNEACPTAFTAGDTKVIADTLRRLSKNTKTDALLSPRIILDLEDYSCKGANVEPVDLLRNDGCIRIDGVLDPELCDQCLKQINEELEQSGQQDHDSTKRANAWDGSAGGFGNVFSRANRYDMYLRKEGVYEESLGHMLQNNSSLACLFEALLDGKEGVFHEFAALVSDPGAASQPIHPDSKYTQVPSPMWTVFVALQDGKIPQHFGESTMILTATLTFLSNFIFSRPRYGSDHISSWNKHTGVSRTFHWEHGRERRAPRKTRIS